MKHFTSRTKKITLPNIIWKKKTQIRKNSVHICAKNLCINYRAFNLKIFTCKVIGRRKNYLTVCLWLLNINFKYESSLIIAKKAVNFRLSHKTEKKHYSSKCPAFYVLNVFYIFIFFISSYMINVSIASFINLH